MKLKIGCVVKIDHPNYEGEFAAGRVVSFDQDTACVAMLSMSQVGDEVTELAWVAKARVHAIDDPTDMITGPPPEYGKCITGEGLPAL